ATVPLRQRDELYARLLDVLEHDDPPAVFEDAYRRICGDADDEGVLACGLGVVLRVLGEADAEAQAICKRWVAELTRGMAIYSHRQAGADGVMALGSIEDLERYCYF